MSRLSIINYHLSFEISPSKETEGYNHVLTMTIEMLLGPVRKKVFKLSTDFSIENNGKIYFPFADHGTEIKIFEEISLMILENLDFEEALLSNENGDEILLSNSDGVFSINQVYGSFNNKSYFMLNTGSQKNFSNAFSSLYLSLKEI
jgi:hypothetical protein